MRGLSFSDFAPENSARYKCMPPVPSSSDLAMPNNTMPMPPSQCVKQRQSCSAGGSTSTRGRTVDPVVVNPEVDSKNASVNELKCGENQNGRHPKKHAVAHTVTTSRIPSRTDKSEGGRRPPRNSTAPAAAVTATAIANEPRPPDPAANPYTSGTVIDPASTIRNSPLRWSNPLGRIKVLAPATGRAGLPREMPTRASARCPPE